VIEEEVLKLETEGEEEKEVSFESDSWMSRFGPKVKWGLMGLLIIATGVYSGFLLSERKGKGRQIISQSGIPEVITEGEIVGSTDTASFRDRAVGILEENEDGPYTEGTHRLSREGGPSQTAYLISSIVDLDQFVGRKVEVWGETFHSDKVGWLMDVGRLKALE
jgi:hypothetical protein